MFRITKLHQILDNMDEQEDNNIKHWQYAIREAIDNGNQQRFYDLLNNKG